MVRSVLLALTLVSGASAQTSTFTSMSQAGYGSIVSPDSIAVGFGTNLATATTPAPALPLQTSLGNVQVFITDSAGVKIAAPLYMVSPSQINYLVPATVAIGRATVSVSSGTASFTGPLLVSNVSPSIETASGNGKGAPAGQIVRGTSSGTVTTQNSFSAGSNSTFTAAPINLTASPTDKVYLMLYGTGVRRHSLNPPKALVGTTVVPITYAGAQSQFPGLDQINVGPFPQSLAGKGAQTLILTVDGVPSNSIALAFQ